MTLYIRKKALVGDPFSDLGRLFVDVRRKFFGSSKTLQIADFGARASKMARARVGVKKVGGWYVAEFKGASFKFINKKGSTQLRLRFQDISDFDGSTDWLVFFSGDAPRAKRPKLVIKYQVP